VPVPIDPPIQFRPRGLPTVEFETFEAAKEWAERELEAWSQFRSGGLGPPLGAWRDEITQPAVNMLTAAEQAIRNFTNQAALNTHRNSLHELGRTYEAGPAIAADSADGQRIIARTASNDLVGAALDGALVVNNKSLAFLASAGGQNQPIDARAVIKVLLGSLDWEAVERSRISATATSLGTVVAEFEGR
jgi:hypothetical protein